MSIRLALVDDHRMFREALRGPLCAEPDFEIVAEAGTGKEVPAAIERSRPDVLLADIALPDISGIEVVRRVKTDSPGVRVIALSGYADKLFVEEMLKSGADGYVVKSSGADELIAAIRAVMAGHLFLSPELTASMVRRPAASAVKSPPPLSVLGKREQEVLRLLASGKRTREIADLLDITAGTVNVHRRNVKHKLGITSTADLTRYAVREGLLAA